MTSVIIIGLILLNGMSSAKRLTTKRLLTRYGTLCFVFLLIDEYSRRLPNQQNDSLVMLKGVTEIVGNVRLNKK